VPNRCGFGAEAVARSPKSDSSGFRNPRCIFIVRVQGATVAAPAVGAKPAAFCSDTLRKRIPGESATQPSPSLSSGPPPARLLLSRRRAGSSSLAGAPARGGLVGSSSTVAGADPGQHGLLPSLSRSSWCHPSPIAASRVPAGLELCPCAAGAQGLPPWAMAECGEVSFPLLPFCKSAARLCASRLLSFPLLPSSARGGASAAVEIRHGRAHPGGQRGRWASSAWRPARRRLGGDLRLLSSSTRVDLRKRDNGGACGRLDGRLGSAASLPARRRPSSTGNATQHVAARQSSSTPREPTVAR
jgi:hypothetical protein